MATKTWNGSDAAFTTDADWGPFGTPVPGDVAVINAGTVTVTGTLAPALAIQLNAGAATSPTLALTSATIQRGDSITDTSANSTATLSFTGANVNAGNITLSGNANPVLTLASDSGTSLTNQGGISILGTGGNIQAFGAGSIVNNGVISMRATAGTVQSDNFFGQISGTGYPPEWPGRRVPERPGRCRADRHLRDRGHRCRHECDGRIRWHVCGVQ